MSETKRDSWSNRFTFILAAVGSAVGLGNAWRFPGLAAKHGGGSFLFVYLILMLVVGIPLLMMEISIGRKTRSGAASAMSSLNKKFEFIGWSATTNAFVIVTYYSVVFAWVILMTVMSFKFSSLTGNPEAASNLWAELVETTWSFDGLTHIAIKPLLCLIISWGFIYYCIRNGASSVGKVVKYTVFLPVICLIIMAVKGITMPGGIEGMTKLFIPDLSAISSASLWIDACGQVFYSLSIMMAIMFAYGSYLPKDSNIAVDAIIIAFSDMAISVLSGIVLFTTMGGVNMLDNMSDSGVATAFIIYPQAMVQLSDNGMFNAVFALIFYFCLCTLAIDSAFSIVEGVSASLSDKFHWNPRKITKIICIISAILSIIFVTSAGVACLDIVDYYANSFNLILIGLLETIAVGWCFNTDKILDEVNKNTNKFKMPKFWFISSIKVIAPLALACFFVWNVYDIFANKNGVYGGYSLSANIILGWLIVFLVFISGLVAYIIQKRLAKKGNIYTTKSWDDLD